MRKYARETAFSMIYGYLMTKEKENEISDGLFDMKRLDEADVKYVFDVYNGVVENINEYENALVKYSEGFRSERIYKVDKALIFAAMSEINVVKTPVPIVVNEIVDFARKFSTEKSMSFINGILGRYVRENGLSEERCPAQETEKPLSDEIILQQAVAAEDMDE